MLPFGATWTRITSPHFFPFGPFIVAGSVGQLGSRRYGFGRLVGLGAGASPRCAVAGTVSAARAIRVAMRTRDEVNMPRILRATHAYGGRVFRPRVGDP